jgi:hypothetical protein
MASRLIPLLIAACAAAAIGCGGSDANVPRADANAPRADATAPRADANAPRADANAPHARADPTGAHAPHARADPTGAHAPPAAAGAAAARTNDSAKDRHSFVAAVPGRRATLWAVGDSAGGAHAAAVARLIREHHPDKLLYLGDIYNGDLGFRAYRRLYRGLPTARTPGNHDWPHHWSGPEWYSFTAAGWRVIELNSQTRRRAQQLRWLRTLLRARGGDCRLAFWHRPRVSAGPHGDAADMDQYWRALQGHARLVVSGHDHDMQRFAPRGSLIQLVAGAGGESLYRVNRSKQGLAFADDTHWGALRVDLARGHAMVAFVSASGRVLNSHQVGCTP